MHHRLLRTSSSSEVGSLSAIDLKAAKTCMYDGIWTCILYDSRVSYLWKQGYLEVSRKLARVRTERVVGAVWRPASVASQSAEGGISKLSFITGISFETLYYSRQNRWRQGTTRTIRPTDNTRETRHFEIHNDSEERGPGWRAWLAINKQDQDLDIKGWEKRLRNLPARKA